MILILRYYCLNFVFVVLAHSLSNMHDQYQKLLFVSFKIQSKYGYSEFINFQSSTHFQEKNYFNWEIVVCCLLYTNYSFISIENNILERFNFFSDIIFNCVRQNENYQNVETLLNSKLQFKYPFHGKLLLLQY